MSPKFPIWIGAILVSGLAMIGIVRCGYDKLGEAMDPDTFEDQIEKEFPDVIHLSNLVLADARERDPDWALLVDCRTPEEFSVSRIPGAVNLESVEAVQKALAEKPDFDGPVVIYCSVGYRSSKLVQDLKKNGLGRAVNLSGSIFGWANDDLPLEKPDGSPATTVHPFNEEWGKLLKPEKRAKLED